MSYVNLILLHDNVSYIRENKRIIQLRKQLSSFKKNITHNQFWTGLLNCIKNHDKTITKNSKMIYTIVNQKHNYHTGHSFRGSCGSIKVAVEISSQKRWIKYGRLPLSVSLWLNFSLWFEHLVRLGPIYVLFQLITRTRCNSLAFVKSFLYSLTRGRHFCLISVKTCTHVCKTTPKYANITWYVW
jgi:hypothetical protein